MPEESAALSVVCRVRPSLEQADPDEQIQICGPEQCVIAFQGHHFVFDQVLDARATQQALFEAVGLPLLDSVNRGTNATVLAYGQTSSGKTYSLMNEPSIGEGRTQKMPSSGDPIFFSRESLRTDAQDLTAPQAPPPEGLLPESGLLVRLLWGLLDRPGTRLIITSLEIYNESIYDVLNEGALLDGAKSERGLQAELVSKEQVAGLIAHLNHHRRTSFTCSNAQSSRSHLIVSIYVLRHKDERSQAAQAERGLARAKKDASHLSANAPAARVAKKKFVPSGAEIFIADHPASLLDGLPCLTVGDLAGSERAKKTKTSGESLDEAKHINQSLTVLNKVFIALGCRPAPKYIPYRESKLTKVLEKGLCERCRAVVLLNVAPEAKHRGETLSTLRFGKRAKKIALPSKLGPQKESNKHRFIAAAIKTAVNLMTALPYERHAWDDHSSLTAVAATVAAHAHVPQERAISILSNFPQPPLSLMPIFESTVIDALKGLDSEPSPASRALPPGTRRPAAPSRGASSKRHDSSASTRGTRDCPPPRPRGGEAPPPSGPAPRLEPADAALEDWLSCSEDYAERESAAPAAQLPRAAASNNPGPYETDFWDEALRLDAARGTPRTNIDSWVSSHDALLVQIAALKIQTSYLLYKYRCLKSLQSWR